MVTAVAIPSAKPQHIRAVAPNLLEEYIATDLDDLHVALGERPIDGSIGVVAVARETITELIATVHSCGFEAETVSVDALLLPFSPHTLAVLLCPDRAVLRWSLHHGAAIEFESLPSLVTALQREHSLQYLAVTTLASADEAMHKVRRDLEMLAAAQGMTFSHTGAYQQEAIEFWAEMLAHTPTPINLCQGEFTSIAPGDRLWRRWRPLAYAAGICLALQIGVHLVVGAVLQHQAHTLHQQTEALYRELFPQDKRIVNIRQQLLNHLNIEQTTEHLPFLSLFDRFAEGIRGISSAEHPVQLRSLSFDATTGQLNAELIVQNIEALDNLQKRLNGHSLKAKVISAGHEGELLIGRLSVGG